MQGSPATGEVTLQPPCNSWDAMFMLDKAPVGCSLLSPGLYTQEVLKNKHKLSGACWKSSGALILCEQQTMRETASSPSACRIEPGKIQSEMSTADAHRIEMYIYVICQGFGDLGDIHRSWKQVTRHMLEIFGKAVSMGGKSLSSCSEPAQRL